MVDANRYCRFVVPGEPVAQPRPRFARRGAGVVAYTPKEHPVTAYKQAVALMARAALPAGWPLEGPVAVRLVFVLRRPKDRIWKRKPMPREWATCKPDTDNFLKASWDAMLGITWRDDAQVVRSEAVKFYAAGNEQPHTDVEITHLD